MEKNSETDNAINPTSYYDFLPYELILEIPSYCDSATFLQLSCLTAKKFHEEINETITIPLERIYRKPSFFWKALTKADIKKAIDLLQSDKHITALLKSIDEWIRTPEEDSKLSKWDPPQRGAKKFFDWIEIFGSAYIAAYQAVDSHFKITEHHALYGLITQDITNNLDNLSILLTDDHLISNYPSVKASLEKSYLTVLINLKDKIPLSQVDKLLIKLVSLDKDLETNPIFFFNLLGLSTIDFMPQITHHRDYRINFAGAYLPKINLSKKNLGLTMIHGANLSEANLSDTNLLNTYLHSANLKGANLTRARMDGARLEGADLGKANLSETFFIDTSLFRANLRGAILNKAQFVRVSLESADLRKTDLSNAILKGIYLTNANLNEANLSETDFTSAHLNNANLINANLSSTNFTYADLSEANLSGANLSNTNFNRAKLTKVNLTEADLSSTNLSEAILIQVNLSKINLREKNLRNTNLTKADLSEANLGKAVLVEAILKKANLSKANLHEANLSGAYLNGANLSGAILTHANLSNTNLNGANLTDIICSSEELKLMKKISWRLVKKSIQETNVDDLFKIEANINALIKIYEASQCEGNLWDKQKNPKVDEIKLFFKSIIFKKKNQTNHRDKLNAAITKRVEEFLEKLSPWRYRAEKKLLEDLITRIENSKLIYEPVPAIAESTSSISSIWKP